MERTLKNLSDLERKFIDAVIISGKTYTASAELLRVDLKTIQQLYKDLDTVWRPLIPIRNKWRSKKVGGSFWDFCHWYLSSEKRCHYCGITEDELQRLHVIGIINKRTSRGKTLEIDRKISSEVYGNLTNLTYSCYWCNNAKTDTFTEDEFKIIGKAIAIVWRNRLNNDNR
jgi:hypothetical protein